MVKQKIISGIQLKETIALLTIKQAQQEVILRKQFHETCESLKPVNLIKDAVIGLIPSSISKNNMVDTATGMTAGYLVKKAVNSISHNPIIKLLSVVLEVGVANFVTKHPEGIKSAGAHLLKNIFRKRARDVEKI